MHHLYPSAKGDPLCPLGFHPQVRWPTRCKRCFRDYKEHVAKKVDRASNSLKDANTFSTPSLPSLSLNSRNEKIDKRSWVSTNNLTSEENCRTDDGYSPPSSWISTPDLANIQNDTQPITTVNFHLPRRKMKSIDTGQKRGDSLLIKNKGIVYSGSDSQTTKAENPQSMKKTSLSGKRIQVKEVETIPEETTNNDVQFLIQVKSKPLKNQSQDNSDVEDSISLAGTETTDTTLVNANESELVNQLESIRSELEITKMKCNRLEREKSDILLRRLAAMETTTSKTTASEVLKLQQKCNEMQHELEDYRDEKKSLMLKVRELEEDLESRKANQQAQKISDDLQSKLFATETLCEELMDENEYVKKELRDMEAQMDELQDNFREDQEVEYTSLKKDLDQTTKNCRILSFKLKKSERKLAQTEMEKSELDKKLKDISDGKKTIDRNEKPKQLEQSGKSTNNDLLKLKRKTDGTQLEASKSEKSERASNEERFRGTTGASADEKISRATLTRGGSQDDPAQLLRDLQDSFEREADLREQLKFAEEEAQTLRKKVSRIEDDNESLVLQVKKMAVRAKTRKSSPTCQGVFFETQEKDEISDNDSTELKLQLELSEQEAAVLRKKVEELEGENHELRSEVKANTKTSTEQYLASNEKIEDHPLLKQKMKVLEDETNDVRKKLTEKERECDRLTVELGSYQKKTRGIHRSKSLDTNQQILDLREQLRLVDQETTGLRDKVQSLESENKKLVVENRKSVHYRSSQLKNTYGNSDEYIDRIATLEVELAQKTNIIEELEANRKRLSEHLENKDDNKTSEKLTALKSKHQMKAMVKNLEEETDKLLLVMKTNDNFKKKLGEEVNSKVKKNIMELEILKEKYKTVQKELEEEKMKWQKLNKTNEELNNTLGTIKESLKNTTAEKSSIQIQINNLKEENIKLAKEKHVFEQQISELQANLELSRSKQDEINSLQRETESLNVSLKMKEDEIKKIKDAHSDIFSESSEKDKNITELKFHLEKLEKKCKQQETKAREQNKTFEAENEQNRQLIDRLKSDLAKGKEDAKKYKSLSDNMTAKLAGLEDTIEQKNNLVVQLENDLEKAKAMSSKLNSVAKKMENTEICKLNDQLNESKHNVAELESKVLIANKSHETLVNKLSRTQIELKNMKLENQRQIKQMKMDFQNERKKLMMEIESEKKRLDRDSKITSLNGKNQKIEGNSSEASFIKQIPYLELESLLAQERHKYDELTAKYEILEEEHVITKAKLVLDKESAEAQHKNMKQTIEQLEKEFKCMREKHSKGQEMWRNEKIEFEGKMKDFARTSHGGDTSDRHWLKALLEEKQLENDQMKKEYNAIHDQMDFMRRDNDDLKRKLDDYEKVNRVQRNISADNSAMEKEMKQLRVRLDTVEKSKKADLAGLKIRYESQIKVVNEELRSLQNQLLRFKREKDTYRHMLETAQKTIGDLHQAPKTTRTEADNFDEMKEYKSKVAMLEEQISCMEDEFSEAKLECSRLKTELISERSSWEVKISELHSKINELEEEKVLSSGRTKIVGLRTKMELAWQKEREEQQRLLQETATLARDLRQTLFEVERERDKERLEAKRKLDQLKKTSEEEQEQTRKKFTEMQYDLFELGNAHAKLRTTNEKLRREKEIYDREKEKLPSQEKVKDNDNLKINDLVEQMDNLKQLAPELFFSKDNTICYTPTPPRRTKSKSRESSPVPGKRESSMTPEEKQQQIQYIMQRLVHTTEDLRQLRKRPEDSKKLKTRKISGIRRASSLEHDNGSISTYDQPTQRKKTDILSGSLKKKSLSLEHTTRTEQSIWTIDSERSSMNSLDSCSDIDRNPMRKDTSLDSRLSGGSTQSERGNLKKDKGFFGKLRKLTKSRSVDDQDLGAIAPTRPLLSKTNSGSKEDTTGSKKDLKERLSDIFKISSGSSAKSNSIERRHETSSTQRPLIRNTSNGRLTPADIDK